MSRFLLLAVLLLLQASIIKNYVYCILQRAMEDTRLCNHYAGNLEINKNKCRNKCEIDQSCAAASFNGTHCWVFKQEAYTYCNPAFGNYTSWACDVLPLISTGKPPSSSDTSYEMTKCANDGLYNGCGYPSCCTTNVKWWGVNLLSKYRIHVIHIWLMEKSNPTLVNLIAEASLTESGTYEECGRVSFAAHDSDGRFSYILCHQTKGLTGRFVRLRYPNFNYLFSFCEIEIFGRVKSNQFELEKYPKDKAIGFKTGAHNTKIMTGERKYPFDDDYEQNVPSKCYNAVHEDYRFWPWWIVELHQEYNVSMVRVFNRGDCCGNRLSPLVIEVSLHIDPSSFDGYNNWIEFSKFDGNAATSRVYDFGYHRVEGLRGKSIKLTRRLVDSSEPLYGTLSLCEVDIYATASTSLTTISPSTDTPDEELLYFE